MIDKFENIVFMDLEANKRYKNDIDLLQLSAIKVKKDINQFEEFDQFCFFGNKIQTRISNLINKPKDFFNNNKFKKPDEVYLDFLNFIEEKKVYVYGNFDQEILNSLFKKYPKLRKIKVFDLQNKINKKLGHSKQILGLNKLAKIFNIDFTNKHCALEDARVLYKICKIVFQIDFDNKLFQENIKHVKNLPSKISNEYIDFKNLKETNFQKNFSFIIFDISYKLIKEELVEEKIDDICISDFLLKDINNFEEIKLKCKIKKIDRSLNVIFEEKFIENSSVELSSDRNKEIIDAKNKGINNIIKKNIDFFEELISTNANELFITNDNQILKKLVEKSYFQISILNKKIKNNEELINIQKEIIKALEFFEE